MVEYGSSALAVPCPVPLGGLEAVARLAYRAVVALGAMAVEFDVGAADGSEKPPLDGALGKDHAAGIPVHDLRVELDAGGLDSGDDGVGLLHALGKGPLGIDVLAGLRCRNDGAPHGSPAGVNTHTSSTSSSRSRASWSG